MRNVVSFKMEKSLTSCSFFHFVRTLLIGKVLLVSYRLATVRFFQTILHEHLRLIVSSMARFGGAHSNSVFSAHR